MTGNARCDTCIYATDDPPGGGNGTGPAMLGGPKLTFCHRYPPTIVPAPTPGGLTIHHAYPIVAPNDWCGEDRPGPAVVIHEP